MSDIALASYKEAIRAQWATELHDRIIPDTMDFVRACCKAHDDLDCVDYDRYYWGKIQRLRNELGRDTLDELLPADEDQASPRQRRIRPGIRAMQIEMQAEGQQSSQPLYITYKKNLL